MLFWHKKKKVKPLSKSLVTRMDPFRLFLFYLLLFFSTLSFYYYITFILWHFSMLSIKWELYFFHHVPLHMWAWRAETRMRRKEWWRKNGGSWKDERGRKSLEKAGKKEAAEAAASAATVEQTALKATKLDFCFTSFDLISQGLCFTSILLLIFLPLAFIYLSSTHKFWCNRSPSKEY